MGKIKLINMNAEEAFQILEESLSHANTKGAFTLADAQVILNALSIIKPLTEKKDETKNNKSA